MEKIIITYETIPVFNSGDIVQLKSGSKPMTICKQSCFYDIFNGHFLVQHPDRVKIYNKDGTATEYEQIVSQRLHQDVLELVKPKEGHGTGME